MEDGRSELGDGIRDLGDGIKYLRDEREEFGKTTLHFQLS